MSHKRSSIRQATKTSLVGATDAEDRVFTNRAQTLYGITLPAIIVFAIDETGEADSIADAPTIRRLELAIDVYAEANENLDDVLDDLTKAIEDVMAVSEAAGEDAIKCQLISTQIDQALMGETPVGVARLTYEVLYLA